MSDALAKAAPDSPMALIGQAIQHLGGEGAKDAAEAIKVMAELKERMEDREARRAFFAALNEFQSRCPVIPKDKESVQVSKDGGNKRVIPYADLDTIIGIVRPILVPLGFSWRWGEVASPTPNTVIVRFYLMHRDGHQEHSDITMPTRINAPMNDAQMSGAVSTYGERYSMCKGLGLVTSKDTDGVEPADLEPLDEDQLADVELLLAKIPGDREAFLKWMGSKSTAAIAKRDYQKAIKALKAKAGGK